MRNGTARLYRLEAVDPVPRSLEPGRYVVADDEGVLLAVEIAERSQRAALVADRLVWAAVGFARWWNPEADAA